MCSTTMPGSSCRRRPASSISFVILAKARIQVFYFARGYAAEASDFSCSSKKSHQKNDAPGLAPSARYHLAEGVPCAPQPNRALRNSRDAPHCSRSNGARGLIPVEFSVIGSAQGGNESTLS
jgi:hypothetical protein